MDTPPLGSLPEDGEGSEETGAAGTQPIPGGTSQNYALRGPLLDESLMSIMKVSLQKYKCTLQLLAGALLIDKRDTRLRDVSIPRISVNILTPNHAMPRASKMKGHTIRRSAYLLKTQSGDFYRNFSKRKNSPQQLLSTM